jgi:large subunit ribosomal protein L18e
MKMILSRSHIKRKAGRKTNPLLLATILAARKQDAWLPVAQRISGPTKALAALNLDQIDALTKAGDTVLIGGKVLASGALTKKVRIVALTFSAAAHEKAKATKSELVTIAEEIKANPKATGIKVLA